MILVLLMMACSEPPPPPPEAPVEATPAAAVDSGAAVDPAELEAVKERLDGLEDRLARLELLLGEMQEQGLVQASSVRFDPSRTRLDAKDTQAALTELYNELDVLRRQVTRDSMGQPGQGLFQLPREDERRGPANPNQGEGPYGPGGKREGK